MRAYLTNKHIFLNELFPTTAVQQKKHGDAAVYRPFFSGLISMFVFDILQTPSSCIQICSKSLYPHAPPWLRTWSQPRKQ
jgi:hypothetical protein